MKKNLLVTLADKNYVNQAKQLFASVYFKAGWKGDYLLLAYDIPKEDLQWFRNKGILVKECRPLYNEIISGFLPVVFSKFYLFTSEFKKWDNVVFLDADIIVRASLDKLTKVKDFAAVVDVFDHKLKRQFTPHPKSNIGEKSDLTRGDAGFVNSDHQLFKQLEKTYNLEELSFNVGVLAFSTNIIEDDTFFNLRKLQKLYGRILAFPEQAILNLFFYEKWQPLPLVYNIFLDYFILGCHIRPKRIKGVILHFIGNDPDYLPWNPKNYFYPEWRSNLEKAKSIDLKKVQVAKKWSQAKVILYSGYLKFRFFWIKPREFFYNFFKKTYKEIDRSIGLVGIFLKNNFPKLYFSLKKLKDR